VLNKKSNIGKGAVDGGGNFGKGGRIEGGGQANRGGNVAGSLSIWGAKGSDGRLSFPVLWKEGSGERFMS